MFTLADDAGEARRRIERSEFAPVGCQCTDLFFAKTMSRGFLRLGYNTMHTPHVCKYCIDASMREFLAWGVKK